MVAKTLGRSVVLAFALPSAAFALGLGDIHLTSSLNAPLDAEIDLVAATPDEINGLRAHLAPQEAFARNGIEWSAFLNSVTVTPARSSDGRDVLRVRSREAITEPFLTLLIEVNWARGQLVREYTVLLDPPLYTPGQSLAPAVAAPAVGASSREGAISRPAAPGPNAAPPVAQAPAAQGSAPAPRAPTAAPAAANGGTYEVRPGDSLSRIASRYTDGVAESRRWMVATFRNNSRAFDGNMNILRSGAVLRLPDAAALEAIDSATATAEVRRQYAAWRSPSEAGDSATSASSGTAAADSGRLRLVTPAERAGGGTAENSSSTATQAAMEGRVRELEAQLNESRRLLEMRNAELAQLQARMSSSGQAASPAAAAPAAPAQTPAVAPPAEGTAEVPGSSASTEPAPAAEPPAEQTPAAAPTAAAAPAEEPSGGSFVDTIKNLWWVVALIIAALAALLGLRAWRAKRDQDFDDSLGRLAAASPADTFASDRTSDTASLRQPIPGPEESFLVEESGSHVQPQLGGAKAAGAPASAPPRNVRADETISSETAINLDQGDPLAEADFHMAYGLYDQAADLVRIAIAREPERRELKLKLLEVFFVWGNKDQFLQTARELADTRDQAAAGEWEKIVIMGKQLAPEDSLFAGEQGTRAAANAGVDLDLQSGHNPVDFDLFGEPVAGESSSELDLDIGSALGEREAGPEDATDRNATIDVSQFNDLHDLDAGSDVAPTVEQPALDDAGANPTIRQKVEMALRQGQGIDQTAELAIDDLGLDLGALDTVDQPGLGSAPDAPTLVAGLDEHSRRVIEEAEGRTRIRPDSAVTSTSPTGPWEFGIDDVAPTVEAPAFDESPTSRLAALNVQDRELDFDLGPLPEDDDATRVAEAPQLDVNLDGEGDGEAHVELDLDVGTDTESDAQETRELRATQMETQRLPAEDLGLPDLEPVTMSEVGTKLDLARAYMDMGDPEGARNILEEVLQEGSVAQKQEAERLIESLPG